MKHFITFCLLTSLFSTINLNASYIDSLRKVAEKSGKAYDWNLVAIYYDEEEIDTALLRFYAQKAYKLAIDENDFDEQGIALLNLCSYYLYMGDLTSSIENVNFALERLNKNGNEELISNAFNILAYIYLESGQYDEAIEIYHKLISIGLQSDDPEWKRNIAVCYGNICQAYDNKGILDSTLLYNQIRLNAAYDIKDTALIVEGLSMFAMLNNRNHRYRESLSNYEEALRLTQLSNSTLDAIFLYMNIATLHYDWEKFELALEFAQKSLQVANNYNEQVSFAKILSMSGGIFIKNGLYRQAVDNALKSLPIIENFPFNYFNSLRTLALSYNKLGIIDSSDFYLSKMETYMNEGQPVHTSLFYTTKGDILFQRELYKEAAPILEKALNLRQTIDKHNIYESVDIYQQLSEAWKIGYKNYEKALYYKQLQLNLTDSIYHKEHSNAMADFNAKYQNAEKELQISTLKLQQEELLRTRTLIITGLIILTALLLVAWLYVLFLRWKKKAESAEWEKQIKMKESAYQASIAEMEKKRLQSYIEGLESERSRLAKEMHDHVSNGLLALEIKMQSSGVSTELTNMANTLQNQVREISHALIPPVFSYASLSEIIDDYIHQQNQLEGSCFQFFLEPEEGWEKLSHQTALDLYRIVQEACSNAIKHAFAKNIVISLSHKENCIELSITDDGKGFQNGEIPKGIGLQTIKERAANQNGVATIESAPGKGTVVQVIIRNEE